MPNRHAAATYVAEVTHYIYSCYYMCSAHMSPKFHSISLYDQPFSSYRPFWDNSQVHQNDRKWPLRTLPGQMYSIYVFLISKFHSVSLHDQPFLRYRPFWDMCTEWPQNYLEPLQGQMYPICVTSVFESQLSFLFTLLPAVFELHAILRQMHWMPPKFHWTLQGNRYPIHMYVLVPESQISPHFPQRPTIFSSAWLCQQSSWNRNLSVVCRPSVHPSVRVAIISELSARISFKF